ncbi:hypothetical protein GGI43DRAFT_129698 [Trichoderma evansii]
MTTDTTETSDAIILSITNDVEAAKTSYETVKGETELTETFHAAGSGLSLFEEALDIAKANIQAVTTSLQSCKKTAALLKTLFEEVSKAPPNKRLERYVAYVEKKGRSSLVENLVAKLMDDIYKTAKDHATGEDLDKLNELQAASNKLKKMGPSVPFKQNGVYQFVNTDGTQFNLVGDGKQYNATDGSPQINESPITGNVYFNTPPPQNGNTPPPKKG